jgi:hypothetical protein
VFGEFTAEWWALAESTRLGEMRLVAREQRAAAMIAIGHHSRAIPDLTASWSTNRCASVRSAC